MYFLSYQSFTVFSLFYFLSPLLIKKCSFVIKDKHISNIIFKKSLSSAWSLNLHSVFSYIYTSSPWHLQFNYLISYSVSVSTFIFLYLCVFTKICRCYIFILIHIYRQKILCLIKLKRWNIYHNDLSAVALLTTACWLKIHKNLLKDHMTR